VDDAVGAAVRGEPLADPAGVGDVTELALQRAPGRILLEASVLSAAARATAADEPQVTEFGRAAVRADDEVPSAMTAPPTPVPRVTITMSVVPAPLRSDTPPPAALASFSSVTGRPMRSSNCARSGSSCQSMLGACIMTERAVDVAAAATPTL
jgi:hypothetical protein